MSSTKIGICLFCEKEKELTREHIPSKNLFVSGEGVDFRFIYICQECNSGYSKDEEFFRNWIVNAHYESSEEATKLFDGPITRAYTRKPALAQHFSENIGLIEVVNSNTGVKETKARLVNLPEDKAKVINVVKKHIRGLAAFHFGNPLEKDKKIGVVQVGNVWLEENKDTVVRMPTFKVKEKVFEYKYGNVPDTQRSLWLLQYYAGTYFLGFISNEESFKKRDSAE